MSDGGRDALRMANDELASFLAAGRRAQVATFDPSGGIHLVPMSYLFWQDNLALWTDPGSQKVRNLRRNPTITCLVEEGSRFEAFRAVQIRGRAELIEDTGASRLAGEFLFARYTPGGLTDDLRASAAAMAGQRVVVVIQPDRVVCWDHCKLSGVRAADIGH